MLLENEGMRALSFFILLFFIISGWASPDEVKSENGNSRLANAHSAYLRSAAHQPVEWFSWGDEAFEKAQKEDKPILLDVGAVWCHWCHVIDHESYENPEIAKIINKNFIPIKVDRDERPDIDTRYQRAVSAISGQGGWPLTAFLTPQGEVFYGGTYFPPEDQRGLPGMKNLLKKIARLYKEKKASLYQDANKISETVALAEKTITTSGKLSSSILDQILENLIQEFDSENGGFGTQPKFPAFSALEFALERYGETSDERVRPLFMTTLEKMAAGGVHDQLGGAFHRYSVDGAWKKPHFEIMLNVNAGLLENFAHAYQVTKKEVFKEAALGIVDDVRKELSDSKNGGFYASQDADASADEDGDYYTWTLKESKQLLDEKTFKVMQAYFDIQERGGIGENGRNVFSVVRTPEHIAQDLKISFEEVQTLIQKGRALFKAARDKRKRPFIDRNIYVGWNALMSSAFLEAFKAFGLEEVKDFALKTLDFLWDHAYVKGEGMYHNFFDGKACIKGMLEDQVHMADAFLRAYQVTGDLKYRVRAIELMDFCIEKFWDETGGFFDVLPAKSKTQGLLNSHQKNFEDAPSPSSNTVAAMVLDQLYRITGKEIYHEKAQKTLECFAPSAFKYGSNVGTYARALKFHLKESPKVVIVGLKVDPHFQALLSMAHDVYRPGKLVLPLDVKEVNDSVLSEDLRALLGAQEKTDRAIAFVCAGTACAAPTDDPNELKSIISTFGVKSENQNAGS